MIRNNIVPAFFFLSFFDVLVSLCGTARRNSLVFWEFRKRPGFQAICPDFQVICPVGVVEDEIGEANLCRFGELKNSTRNIFALSTTGKSDVSF